MTRTVSVERACELTSESAMRTVRERSLKIYEEASAYARQQGVIVADTKFEWGWDGSDWIL